MTDSWRWLLVVAALLIGAFAFACGDDDNGNGDDNGDKPTAEATAEDGDGNGNGDGDGDAGGDAFEDVPLPDGAEEGETITLSGTELPFFVPPGADVDAAEFGEIVMKSYEVAASPEEVANFYKDNRGDWNDAFTLTTEEGGILIWTKGDDRAVWIAVSEGIDSAGTELVIIAGQRD